MLTSLGVSQKAVSYNCQHRILKQGSSIEQNAQKHSQYQGYLALKTQSLAKLSGQ